MIIEETVEHQHEDDNGRVFGGRHLIMAYHTSKKTRVAHNKTIVRDGLDDLEKCKTIGLKHVPLQKGEVDG